MNLYCHLCGIKGSKATMIVSRGTGNAYCKDEIGCGRRQYTIQHVEKEEK